jgi:hypothetical protein
VVWLRPTPLHRWPGLHVLNYTTSIATILLNIFGDRSGFL